MNNKYKEPMASTQAIKRGYVSWNKQMDDILTRVLLEEINNKEKGDGDLKHQAYQAVVDELKKELGITINVDHEKKNAAPYRNKCIKNWEDICILFGEDRAVGDESEQHDEATDVMDGKWLVKEEVHPRIPLIRALASIMRAIKRFMNGNPDEFLMLKELPENEKLEWVLLCLAE
ncbi:Phosphate permease PHO89 [Bienertia sinuspersici]